jgi:hypothetical protein
MPGTNAILNALEFYEFSQTDCYVLLEPHAALPDAYYRQWPNVHFISIPDYPGRSLFWHLTFADFYYALENLFDKYEAILFWGADVCIVDNFEFYFKLAVQMNLPILGTNEHQGGLTHRWHTLSPHWPYRHTNDLPLADVPMFIPAARRDLIERCCDYQSRPGNVLERMDCIVYAIRDLQSGFHAVPGAYWIFNVPNQGKVQRWDYGLYFAGARLHSFHRRYWNVNYLKNYITGFSGPYTEHNARVFNYMWNLQNRELRVKWLDGLEIYE